MTMVMQTLLEQEYPDYFTDENIERMEKEDKDED